MAFKFVFSQLNSPKRRSVLFGNNAKETALAWDFLTQITHVPTVSDFAAV